MHTKILELLQLAVANKASDIHLAEGVIPKIRINGELMVVSSFNPDDVNKQKEMILSVLTDEQRVKIEKDREIDFSLAIAEARFRVNMYYENSYVACALRVVPSDIPDISTLNLPSIVGTFTDIKQGFILVTGPTGHGKSTTVASLINQINIKKNAHIVTIEDPIEYQIKPVKSLISQREVGYDTLSFEHALRSCLRQDPNVVFVGEMRDLETISSALTIAETGHLVFSTLHTNSAAQSIDRIIDVFPEGAKEQIRIQMAAVITAIVSQRLMPTTDGGRVPGVEILIATPAIRNMIREGKTFMIDNAIETGADLGMLSL